MSWKRGIELFDIIDGIVDDMRNTGGATFTGVVANGYEYAALNELKAGEYISITDTSGVNDNLLIISATANSFVVESNIPTALEFKAYAPYFRHEKIQKASQIYHAKSGKGVAAETQKYPLVLLVHSYPQSQDNLDFDYESTFTIHIVTKSNADYDSTKRYAINITPTLIPIQEELIQGLADSIYTKLNTPNLIDKEWTDLLYVDNNPFPDKLDGIQLDITDLQILDIGGCDVTPAPTEFNLTTQAGAGGVINPVYTNEPFAANTNVAICAEPEEGFVTDEITVNTIPISDPSKPFIVKMNQVKLVIASFIASGLTLFMQIFDSAPVQRGLSWFFGDHSTKDNDVEVGNVMGGTFASGTYINTSFILPKNTPLNIDIVDFLPSTGGQLFRVFSASPNNGSYLIVSGNILQFINFSFGNTTQTINVTELSLNTLYYISLIWDGLAGSQVVININGNEFTNTVNFGWTNDMTEPFWVSSNASSWTGNIFYFKLNSLFEYAFNHGQLDKIRNLLDPTGATDGTITGAVLATFWGSTADNIEPYDTTLGCTLYKNNGDNSIMPICVNTSQVIVGFTRLGYFPAGSGALKGLPNKYYISGVDSIIPEGWYTIEELIAFESANVVITQDVNTVSLFKVSL